MRPFLKSMLNCVILLTPLPTLERKIDDFSTIQKILCSLSDYFHAKVTTIDESKDVDTIKIKELIGLLQTFEMSF